MRAEFADQIRQIQAQINQIARVASDNDQRAARLGQLMERLFATLQAEANGGR